MASRLRRDLETAARAIARAGEAKAFTADDLAFLQRIALDAGALPAHWQGRLIIEAIGQTEPVDVRRSLASDDADTD